MPEEVMAHAELAHSISTPVALGESYRTHYELAPFFEKRAVGLVQPDLGRCGITEGLRIARIAQELGLRVVPHVSIALGPQIAAAIHLAAALPNCDLLEFNPSVLDIANRFLAHPILARQGHYIVPQEPGLGASIAEMPPCVTIQSHEQSSKACKCRVRQRSAAFGRNPCHSEPFAVILSAPKNLCISAQGKLHEGSACKGSGKADSSLRSE